jgi:hypothetical protein
MDLARSTPKQWQLSTKLTAAQPRKHPYFHVLGWRLMGSGYLNRFNDHLYIRLGTKSNYGAIPNFQNSQIVTAHAKPFPACCVFTSRSLTTASNSTDSIFTACRAELPNNWLCPLLIISQQAPRRTPVSKSNVFVAAGKCLLSRCLATGIYATSINRCKKPISHSTDHHTDVQQWFNIRLDRPMQTSLKHYQFPAQSRSRRWALDENTAGRESY